MDAYLPRAGKPVGMNAGARYEGSPVEGGDGSPARSLRETLIFAPAICRLHSELQKCSTEKTPRGRGAGTSLDAVSGSEWMQKARVLQAFVPYWGNFFRETGLGGPGDMDSNRDDQLQT